MKSRHRILLLVVLLWTGGVSTGADKPPPNIVLVLTDDQGYGDLHFTGNPIIRTPHLDALAAASSQLLDYHVAPTCSPTRAALLTGRWNNRTGVWHTVNGRSILHEDETTLATLLSEQGYLTGMFGKWHLGDSFPYRAEDRGFLEVYRHGGGGIGQTPDVWNNAYFDGHYFQNGRTVAAQGYCTDVFFAQAHEFIRQSVRQGRPFFAYIATNAPHGPLHVPQKYLDLYAGQTRDLAAFYGMISNIDEQVGGTRALLRQLGMEENTLFIFTTDNGTATGAAIYNAGMRGAKGSEYDGGHRVPFLAHWPAAGWNQRHVSDRIAHAVDLVPTILDVIGSPIPTKQKLDGISLRPLLDPGSTTPFWPDRFLVADSQRVKDPVKWKQTAVMTQRWRLVNNKELYDIEQDPGQRTNVFAIHPQQVDRMRTFYDAWWQELQPTFARMVEFPLRDPRQLTMRLTSHDWIQETLPPWNQQQIREAYGYSPVLDGRASKSRTKSAEGVGAGSRHVGFWPVNVLTRGDYEISVRRWPAELDHPITAPLGAEPDVPGASKAWRTVPGVAIPAVSAVLRLDGEDVEMKPVTAADCEITFTLELDARAYRLAPFFRTADGQEIGAYYVEVRQPSRAAEGPGTEGAP